MSRNMAAIPPRRLHGSRAGFARWPAAAVVVVTASPIAVVAQPSALRNHMDYLFREAAALRARPHPPRPPLPLVPRGDYDILAVDAEISFDPVRGTVDVTGSLELRSQRPSLTRIDLVVAHPFDVTSIRDDIGPLAYSYDPGEGALEVTPRSPVAFGETTRIIFALDGTPACGWDCSVGPEITYLGLMDLVPVDQDATDRVWEDQFLATYRIVTTAGTEVVASGRLAGTETLPGGLVRRSYVHAEPGLYAGFAAAGYAIRSGAGLVPLTVAGLPGHDSYADAYLEIMREAVGICSDGYGDYAYPQFAMAEIPYSDYIGGLGLEALVLIVEPHAADPTLPFGQMILAHETGHQWWANMVPVGDWDAPWLAEGFAEMSALLYVERAGRPRAYADWEASAARALHGDLYVYLRLFSSDDCPLTSPRIWSIDDNAYVVITYYKGAMVVEGLRAVVGDAAFFTAMRDYVASHRTEPVDTDDVREALERSSGRDLGWYFDRWVYDTGYPTYWVETTIAPDSVRVRITLDDTGFSEMPLLVRTVGPGGTSALTVTIGAGGSTLVELDGPMLPTGGAAYVEVDPLYRFPRRVAGNHYTDVALSGDVDGFDLIAVAWAQGTSVWEQSVHWNAQADVDSDGAVGPADLSAVMRMFGAAGL